jgi:hypothetical protein
MLKALTITRDDYTAAELREAATHSNDADATRRMLALALVLISGAKPASFVAWTGRPCATGFYSTTPKESPGSATV